MYDYAFDRYNAEDTTGLSRADLDATARALRRYFNNGEPTFYHTVTEDGLPAPVFNARETRHMEDVKRVVVVRRTALQEVAVVYVLVVRRRVLHLGARGQRAAAGGAEPASAWDSAPCSSAASASSPRSASTRRSARFHEVLFRTTSGS